MAAGPLIFWLVLMGAAVSDIVNGRIRPEWLAVAGLVVFCGLYAATVLAAARERVPAAVRYVLLAALAVFTAWYVHRFGHNANETLPLLAMAAGAALPLVWPAVGGVAATTLLAVLIGVRTGDVASVGGIAFGTGTAGAVIVVLRRLFATIAELQATREELAHAAVSRERRRFARDLHDLLGHTLSVIVVKGEIVRRLAVRDPEAAAAQAGDIVEIGRAALGEVREAVSGYRTRGLSAELDDARMALDDAGVEAIVTRGGPPPPAETDLLLGWVVREAVTNVIRHADARQCRIGVTGDDVAVTVTITDDGQGVQTPSYGNGLTGMHERVTAAGGDLHAGPGRRGGFTVTATVSFDATGADENEPREPTVRSRAVVATADVEPAPGIDPKPGAKAVLNAEAESDGHAESDGDAESDAGAMPGRGAAPEAGSGPEVGEVPGVDRARAENIRAWSAGTIGADGTATGPGGEAERGAGG